MGRIAHGEGSQHTSLHGERSRRGGTWPHSSRKSWRLSADDVRGGATVSRLLLGVGSAWIVLSIASSCSLRRAAAEETGGLTMRRMVVASILALRFLAMPPGVEAQQAGKVVHIGI